MRTVEECARYLIDRYGLKVARTVANEYAVDAQVEHRTEHAKYWRAVYTRLVTSYREGK